jgi:hypothetical protein
MCEKKAMLTDLSENECESINGGAEGDAAKLLGKIVGAIGGAIVAVYEVLTTNDPKMSESLMNCI